MWYLLCPVAKNWWGCLSYFKANICLHYSCADRTDNLKWYLHASRAFRGHPLHNGPGFNSKKQRCMCINNIKNVNPWKSKIYFYKQHGPHRSSCERSKLPNHITCENRRSWMHPVLFLADQTGFSFAYMEKECDMWGEREINSFTCWHMCYFHQSTSTYGCRWNMHPPKKRKEKKTAFWSWMQYIRTGDQVSINHITSCTGKSHSRLCP